MHYFAVYSVGSNSKMLLLLAIEPVVLLHGLGSSSADMDKVKTILEKETGRKIINCNIGPDETYKLTIQKQAEALQKCIKDAGGASKGFIGIGHSNGAYVMRHYLQLVNDPPMQMFISLAGPLNGYYCDHSIAEKCLYEKINSDYTPEFAKQMAYLDQFQQLLGPVNYFRDVQQMDKYVAGALSLPVINNEKEINDDVKKNFLSVKRLIAFGSDNDGVILPAQSTMFGDYVESDGKYTEVPFTQTVNYKDDTYGLKTLYEQNKLWLFDSGLQHGSYVTDESFIKNILADFIITFESDEGSSQFKSFKAATIALAVIGVLFVAAFVVVLVLLLQRKKQAKKQDSDVMMVQ